MEETRAEEFSFVCYEFHGVKSTSSTFLLLLPMRFRNIVPEKE